jgi:hypothetical protein
MEVFEIYTDDYSVAEDSPEFSLYDFGNEENTFSSDPGETYLKKHDENITTILNRKYDEYGKRRRSSGSDYREDRDQEDWEKERANERKEKISKLFLEEGSEEAEELLQVSSNDRVLSTSEQLWEGEELEENELNWKEFLSEYGKTPEDSEEKEHILSILTPKDIANARKQKYFGQEKRRI